MRVQILDRVRCKIVECLMYGSICLAARHPRLLELSGERYLRKKRSSAVFVRIWRLSEALRKSA